MDELIKQIIWPACILILVIVLALIFWKPLAALIGRINSVEGEGKKWKIHFDANRDTGRIDKTIQLESSMDAKGNMLTPATNVDSKLSEDEQKKSKQKAQQRLDEDIKRVGYERGKLYQLKDGAWGIAWEIKVGDGIVIKDDTKSDSGKGQT